MKKCIDDDSLVIFTDETWNCQYGSCKVKDWQDDNRRSAQARTKDSGARNIICHAVSKDDWVQGAHLFLESGVKPKPGDDYHNEMNAETYEKWFKEQLVPYLPNKPCVIVMDNAPYHSRLLEKCPNLNFNKKTLHEWQTKHNVPSDLNETNVALRRLCAIKQKTMKTRYVLNEWIVENSQHEISLGYCQGLL